jgi:hypothetical protein
LGRRVDITTITYNNLFLGGKKVDAQKNDPIDEIDFSKGIVGFAIKSLILSLAIVFCFNALVPDIPKIPETERNKLILLSFIQNPYVLWKLSEFEETKGNIENASKFIEAAIALMEMHGATDKSLNKYQEKLKKLKNTVPNKI